MKIRHHLVCHLAALLIGAASLAAAPLESAQSLAAHEFKDWTYGANASEQKIDCVQFLVAVLEKELSRTLTAAERSTVLISPAPADLDAAVVQKTDQTRGVQHAVVDVIKKGKTIEPGEAKVGDFIQYWMKKSDGTYLGHCAVISRVWQDSAHKTRVALYGAHQSLNGIADNDFGGVGLNLAGPDRFIYIARLD